LITSEITLDIQTRLTKIFTHAKSSECRAKISEHFGYFLASIGKERPSPFSNFTLQNECQQPYYNFDNREEGVTIQDYMNVTYQPPRDEADYLDNAADLKLLFGILTHGPSDATIRLVESLYEDGHLFVIHVDGKEINDDSYQHLLQYAQNKEYVHIVPNINRVRVNWGGYSMVNATMQILKYSFGLLEDSNISEPLHFHKFVHLASTSYPIVSNNEIRHRIASYPLDANFFNIVLRPTNPNPRAWHYFVECDDALHRIYNLPVLTEKKNSFEVYTSSQWFISSRDFAEYMAKAESNSLVAQFMEYAEHVVVADEQFFGSLLLNSKFCDTLHNSNFLHVQFDRWESSLEDYARDKKKCLMPDPNRCGRSPTIMTMDYLFVLEMSGALFARKFDDNIDLKVKNVIDRRRSLDQQYYHQEVAEGRIPQKREVGLEFEGHGTLIVAKESVNTTDPEGPLCLGLGPKQNKVNNFYKHQYDTTFIVIHCLWLLLFLSHQQLKLVPCFRKKVIRTLVPGWETGAVIEEEIRSNNQWSVGPCSSDGALNRMESGEMKATRDSITDLSPHCMIKQMNGLRKGRCIDIESERVKPGGEIQVYPCINSWHQIFAFGDGKYSPKNSLYTSVPTHIVTNIEKTGKVQATHLCLSTQGRGDFDEEEWEEDKSRKRDSSFDKSLFIPDEALVREKVITNQLPLDHWKNKQLVTTDCSNHMAVVTFLFVPFIVEESMD